LVTILQYVAASPAGGEETELEKKSIDAVGLLVVDVVRNLRSDQGALIVQILTVS